ncbi:hypothetical protein BV898_04065 [Hypsibius exemplaris]|uniref:Receptor ligand binding region domain-containing protein n=1 Tax=Hypsibius exemplaris TaxID=2072580 RepID=A0A1W0X346_HYPEX|nr:hypothetical protein BV898_04065 [Hypsibius exemplaris]
MLRLIMFLLLFDGFGGISGDLDRYDIEIVTPTYFGVDALFALNYEEPAYITGIRALRDDNPGLQVTYQVLSTTNATSTCVMMKTDVQDLLALWYYRHKRKDSIPVFLMSGCLEVEYIHQLAKAWNILMITTGNADVTSQDKVNAPTWITTTLYPSNYGQLYRGFLERNNWTTVASVLDLDTNGPAGYISTSLLVNKRLREYGFTLASWTRTSQEPDAIVAELDAILLTIREISRVVLHFGAAPQLRRFLVYIALWPFPHTNFGRFRWQEFDENDVTVRAAYQSVILLQIIYVDQGLQTRRATTMDETWTAIARNSSLLKLTELPFAYLEQTHGAFQMLGQVLSNLTKGGPNESSRSILNSGRNFAAQFFSRTFLTDNGPITLNAAGVRATTSAFKQFNNKTGELEISVIAREQGDYSYEWHTLRSPSWYGGNYFPPNEPFCGFTGQAKICRSDGIFGFSSGDIDSYDIEIVTPTYIGVDSLFALNYQEPAYVTGISALKKQNPRLSVTYQILTSTNATTDCVIMKNNVQDVLARWYYREKRKDSVPVILMSACLEVEFANQLAKAWNILMIPTVNTDATIRDKVKAPTWITTTLYPSNYGDLYRGFLARNNWTTVASVLNLETNGPPVYTNIAYIVNRRLREYGFNLTSWTRETQEPASAVIAEIDAILLTIRDICRVILHYGPAYLLRQFLIRASRNNMINENYVYIAARPFAHTLFGRFRWQEFDQDDETVREAYKSVILLQIIYVEEQRETMDGVWSEIGRNSSLRKLRELPFVYLTQTHGAFQMLGQVLANLTKSDALNKSRSILNNGRDFAAQFFSRTFATDNGDITLNGAGVRATTSAVKQFNNNTGELEIFLIAREQSDYSYEWHALQPASWYGENHFPPNEPFCGFAGQADVCLPDGSRWASTITIICSVFLIVFCALLGGFFFVRAHMAKNSTDWWIITDLFPLRSSDENSSLLVVTKPELL